MNRRLIARLDIKNGRVIKGISFEGLRVVGDPDVLASRYYNQGVNELLYIDTVASLYGRSSLAPLLASCSENIFIPITAGGGVRSTGDAQALLSAGADKIAVNTAAIYNPKLLSELVSKFGSQCVVSSIQVRYSKAKHEWFCLVDQGRELTSLNLSEWLTTVQDLGVGEILISSVDCDGRLQGPDHQLIDFCSRNIDIPWIYSGGLTNLHSTGASPTNNLPSYAIGAALHYDKLNLTDAFDSSFEFIPSNLSKQCVSVEDTVSATVSILDIGLGNTQSLRNSLQRIGCSVKLISKPDAVLSSDILFMPGVGAFPEAMSRLKKYDLIAPLKERHRRDLPLIGICLGMQLMFSSSTEIEYSEGLNLIEGAVSLLDPDRSSNNFLVPHIGWSLAESSDYVSGSFYFVHSYAVHDLPDELVAYRTSIANDYTFVSGVRMNNTVGLQFHPERSGLCGLQLLSSLINSFS